MLRAHLKLPLFRFICVYSPLGPGLLFPIVEVIHIGIQFERLLPLELSASLKAESLGSDDDGSRRWCWPNLNRYNQQGPAIEESIRKRCVPVFLEPDLL